MTVRKPILKISNMGVKTKLDPLRRFESCIRSKETLYAYKKTLREFLDAVENFTGTFEEKAQQFYDFAIAKPEEAQGLVEDYAIHLKKRTQKPRGDIEYLNPSVVPNKIKSIKKFCKMNKIQIVWEEIHSFYPEYNNIKQTRGFTTEEIKQILDQSTSVQNDFIILTMASSGIRIGAWNYIKWAHISPVYEQNGKFSHNKSEFANPRIVCASMVVYAGTSEEYNTLISIEAFDKLQSVRKQWVKIMQREPTPDDSILISNKTKKPMNSDTIRTRLGRFIHNASLFERSNIDRRHDVPFTHGFRKRYNKIMVDQQNKNDSHGNHIRKERLLGHKSALSNLEDSYYYSNVLEAVPQYLEGMSKLMIGDNYKKDWDSTKQDNNSYEILHKEIEELQAKITRIGKYQKI